MHWCVITHVRHRNLKSDHGITRITPAVSLLDR